MSNAPGVARVTPRRRRLRWFVIPLLLLALLVASGVYLYVRGTWADTEARNPVSPADGPVAQVYQPPGQGKRVRAAIVLPYPAADVWKVVTDYEHYESFLPYLADVKAERLVNGCRLTGRARSLLGGYWPFAITVHEEKAADHSIVSWDENGEGDVQANRGGWEVRPTGPGQTLLVLSLETEVKHYPRFVLRDAFLHRLKEVLRQVRHRMDESSPNLHGALGTRRRSIP